MRNYKKYKKYKGYSKVKSFNPYMLFSIFIVGLIAMSVGYATFTDTLKIQGTANAKYTVYQITYVLNGGVNPENVVTTFRIIDDIPLPVPTKTSYVFAGWYTNENFTGERIITTDELEGDTTLYAYWEQDNGVAKIDDTYYDTLQEAINAVPNDNTQTTIKLLKDICENVIVNKNKNIVFNLQNYTISNSNNTAIISNDGTILISNGIISTNSENTAAINNNSTGKITISGGKIIANGKRQALYNNGGIVEITGNAYLSSSTSERAAVHNYSSGGTLTITGGTIISKNRNAVENLGIMIIGTKDGESNKNSPVLQGFTYGISSSNNYKVYDGIIKGKTAVFNNENKIEEVETDYELIHRTEIIETETYKIAYLGKTVMITLDPNGGNITDTDVKVEKGVAIGTLPSPTWKGYDFDGWYTDSENGEKITEETVITANKTYYAHWKEAKIAQVNETIYNTLQAAIDAVPTDNTKTTVKLLRNVCETVVINQNQNIVFNLQDYTISNELADKPGISNYGTLEIYNGTFTSNSRRAAVIDNNLNAKLTIRGGKIIATGTRQAVYNDRGTLEITGDAYLISSTTERATLHNLNSGGTINITGGTIISTIGRAVENNGTLNVGTKDGESNKNSPIIQGVTYGINSSKNYNFYDGIIKCKAEVFNDETKIVELETGYNLEYGEEQIESENYNTVYLKKIEE